MATRRESGDQTLTTRLFGRSVQAKYSTTGVGYGIISLRLVMGYILLSAGLGKLAAGGWTNPGAWSAEEYLVYGVAEANPLKGLYLFFAEYLWLVDPLVVWTQILIGLALLLGVFVRLAAFGGVIQMVLFWMGAWTAGLAAGLPVENGYVISYQFVYALLLFILGAIGAGRIFGLDAKLEETRFVEANPWLRYLLG